MIFLSISIYSFIIIVVCYQSAGSRRRTQARAVAPAPSDRPVVEFRGSILPPGLPRPRGHPLPDWMSHPVAPPAYSSAPPTYPINFHRDQSPSPPYFPPSFPGDNVGPPPSYSQTTALAPPSAEIVGSPPRPQSTSSAPQGGATVVPPVTATLSPSEPNTTRNRETETNTNNQVLSQADIHLR